MHVAIRLSDQPVRIFDGPRDPDGRVVGTAVLNGVRVRAYCKQAADSAPSVGAMLQPGAADLLSNTPAGALRGRHTRLEDLWPASTLAELREQLEATPSLAQRLAIFEDVLASRLPALRSIDPLVAETLFRLDLGMPVGRIVAESGFSHRHIVRVFTESVGVPPKTYFRLGRFNRTLRHLHAAPHAALADVAALMGYADQAHMSREFHEFAGLTPRRFLRTVGQSPHHVPFAA